jgi:hypothetical protein
MAGPRCPGRPGNEQQRAHLEASHRLVVHLRDDLQLSWRQVAQVTHYHPDTCWRIYKKRTTPESVDENRAYILGELMAVADAITPWALDPNQARRLGLPEVESRNPIRDLLAVLDRIVRLLGLNAPPPTIDVTVNAELPPENDPGNSDGSSWLDELVEYSRRRAAAEDGLVSVDESGGTRWRSEVEAVSEVAEAS